MAHNWKNDLPRCAATPEAVFLNRRQILAAGGAAALVGGAHPAAAMPQGLEPNSFEEITSYNNFYEFGTGKTDPKQYAGRLTTDPWSVEIDGLCDRPQTVSADDLIARMEIEDRTYRLRCVEGWSMVIPWQGFELADLLSLVGVREDAKFVRFQTALVPDEMPGIRLPILDWPYVEGLRLDEAMHPLTIVATGLYDRPLPNQNGAPLRLVVPWKYGFKSIKSIVRITLTDTRPLTTWEKSAPSEYGFYANVNPDVDHPRWSQATERVIGGGLFSARQDTAMFNGYDEVAALYEGMDLQENF